MSKNNYKKCYYYWCVNGEDFRAKGRVETPLFSTQIFTEASEFKSKNPQSVIVRTGIGHKGIIFQQITRHEVRSKFSTFDKSKNK